MEVTIPTCWDDITLEKYIKLRPVLQTEQTPIQRVINILCVLTGEKREVVKDIKLDDYNKILSKMEFLNTELPKEIKGKRFEVGGKHYEFSFDAKKLLFGEYISAMEMLQDAQTNEEVIFNNLPKILTTICRPVEKKWLGWRDIKLDGELIRETVDNFYKNMPITIAYPIGVFFYTHLQTSTQDTKISLVEEATKIVKEMTEEMRAERKEIVSQNAGDGGV